VVKPTDCEMQGHRAMEQRVNIMFCCRLGKTVTDMHQMVQVYGTEAVSRKCVYDWFKRFSDGNETTEDEPCSVRQLTSRTPDMVEWVRQMLAQDWRVTLRLMAEELGISKDTVHTIVCEDLQTWWQSKNVWQQFCDWFLKRPLPTVSRSFMNVENSMLWRMAIILKASKVVFWYHSPNFLDTPHI
jgi:transposase